MPNLSARPSRFPSQPIFRATPLAGIANATTVIGPFHPVFGRSVILSLDGTWEGQVQLLRSPDNGVTRLPVTFGGAPWAIFGSNCCEPVWEERAGVALYPRHDHHLWFHQLQDFAMSIDPWHADWPPLPTPIRSGAESGGDGQHPHCLHPAFSSFAQPPFRIPSMPS
jgi:hypothetical protein